MHRHFTQVVFLALDIESSLLVTFSLLRSVVYSIVGRQIGDCLNNSCDDCRRFSNKVATAVVESRGIASLIATGTITTDTYLYCSTDDTIYCVKMC